jgi:hypothetical protein
MRKTTWDTEHTISNTIKLTLKNRTSRGNGCESSERDCVFHGDAVVGDETSGLRSGWKEQGKLEQVIKLERMKVKKDGEESAFEQVPNNLNHHLAVQDESVRK